MGHSQSSLSSQCVPPLCDSAGFVGLGLRRKVDGTAGLACRELQGRRRAHSRRGATGHRFGAGRGCGLELGGDRPRAYQELPVVLGADHSDHRQRVDARAVAVLRPQHVTGHPDPKPQAVHHGAARRRGHRRGSVSVAGRRRRALLPQGHRNREISDRVGRQVAGPPS